MIKIKFKQTEIGRIPKEQKSLNESIDFLLKILGDVRKDTEKDQKEKVYIWSKHFSNRIEIWKYFDESIGRENFIKSCVGFRLIQLNKELLVFWLECTSGIYDTARGRLRYVLESFLQAYYVDREHPTASMACKLEILKEIDKDNNNFIGARLIEKLNVDTKYGKQIKKLNSELNKFVHPSFNEWQKIVENVSSKITFSYDKESFEECVDLTDRVIDTIVFLLMNFSNEVVEKIKGDEIFLKSISNVKNSLVIQYIKESGSKDDKK